MTSYRLRAGTIVVQDKRILLVRLRDPKTQKDLLFPPGGKIEPGEQPMVAAERETLEETGYSVKADAKTHHKLDYKFHWNGKTRDCTTHFYKAKILSHQPEKFEPEDPHHEVHWKKLSEIENIFSYHEILKNFILGYLALEK